jgi:hypothetical protein
VGTPVEIGDAATGGLEEAEGPEAGARYSDTGRSATRLRLGRAFWGSRKRSELVRSRSVTQKGFYPPGTEPMRRDRPPVVGWRMMASAAPVGSANIETVRWVWSRHQHAGGEPRRLPDCMVAVSTLT